MFDEKNVTSNKTTCKLSTAKVCNKVISNLFIASHQRTADLDNLFRHEISLPPPSFYTAGEVNICSAKSKLLDCLLADYIILPFNINCPAILVDGSSVAQSHKPNGVRTFGEYIEKPVIPLIHKYLSQYNRVDIPF